jgi:thioredoxin 1
MVEELTNGSFNEKIKDKAIVDFWAPWCGPCQWLAPVFEELSEEYKGKLTFGKVNVDEQSELAMQFQVSSIPCIVLFKDGKEVDRILGFNPKEEIKERIDAFLGKL